jgi:hypothetical protein
MTKDAATPLAIATAKSEAMAKEVAAAQGGAGQVEVQRRKVGRGSTRRIVRAKDTLDAALAAFRKEMDLEVYQVDTDGQRSGPWPVLVEIDAFRVSIAKAVSEILT